MNSSGRFISGCSGKVRVGRAPGPPHPANYFFAAGLAAVVLLLLLAGGAAPPAGFTVTATFIVASPGISFTAKASVPRKPGSGV